LNGLNRILGDILVTHEPTSSLSYLNWKSYFAYIGVENLRELRSKFSDKYDKAEESKSSDVSEPLTQEKSEVITYQGFYFDYSHRTTNDFKIEIQYDEPSTNQRFFQCHLDGLYDGMERSFKGQARLEGGLLKADLVGNQDLSAQNSVNLVLNTGTRPSRKSIITGIMLAVDTENLPIALDVILLGPTVTETGDYRGIIDRYLFIRRYSFRTKPKPHKLSQLNTRNLNTKFLLNLVGKWHIVFFNPDGILESAVLLLAENYNMKWFAQSLEDPCKAYSKFCRIDPVWDAPRNFVSCQIKTQNCVEKRFTIKIPDNRAKTTIGAIYYYQQGVKADFPHITHMTLVREDDLLSKFFNDQSKLHKALETQFLSFIEPITTKVQLQERIIENPNLQSGFEDLRKCYSEHNRVLPEFLR